MSWHVFSAAGSFTFFFYLFNCLIALLYQILGVDIGGHPDSSHDGNDYKRVHPFVAYFLYSFRNSVGDLEAPNAATWTVIS